MEIIKSLNNVEYDVLYKAFEEAFKDYEIQVTKKELLVMLRRRGFVLNYLLEHLIKIN